MNILITYIETKLYVNCFSWFWRLVDLCMRFGLVWIPNDSTGNSIFINCVVRTHVSSTFFTPHGSEVNLNCDQDHKIEANFLSLLILLPRFYEVVRWHDCHNLMSESHDLLKQQLWNLAWKLERSHSSIRRWLELFKTNYTALLCHIYNMSMLWWIYLNCSFWEQYDKVSEM